MSEPTGGGWRRALLLLYVLSFVPYLLPDERRPALYRDGKPETEIATDRRKRAWRRYLGGDLTRIAGWEAIAPVVDEEAPDE